MAALIDDRQQAAPIQVFGHGLAEGLEQRRQQVDHAHLLGDADLLAVHREMRREAQDQRHAHHRLVDLRAVLHVAVLAEGLAVVGREYEYGVVEPVEVAQRAERAVDLAVRLVDALVVVQPHVLGLGGRRLVAVEALGVGRLVAQRDAAARADADPVAAGVECVGDRIVVFDAFVEHLGAAVLPVRGREPQEAPGRALRSFRATR